ncbi:TlpA disulfide reductase family protein [Sphingobacterium sp.]|uniref:TlpA family protein disulfide reductase n=1 Tax=Sphingobacterium sp. TaxID=341027 RepID=UPI0031D0A29A
MDLKIIIKALELLLFCLTCFVGHGQESNNNKKLWAKSILNQKAPKLEVEQWLSAVPDTKGKFVLIDFWATWCGPCRKVIPELNEWHKKYNDKLVIIGVSDEKAEVVKKAKEIKIDYFSAVDTKARLKKQLEVQGIPHCILLDPDGIVRWEGFPTLEGHELTDDVVADIIRKYSRKRGRFKDSTPYFLRQEEVMLAGL